MYKCEVCHQTSPPGRPRKTWLVLRRDRSVAREVPCCPRCHHLLGEGVPLAELTARFPPPPRPEPGTRAGRGKVAPAPAPPPPPPPPPAPPADEAVVLGELADAPRRRTDRRNP
jgi:hypothetical protein